MKVPFCFTFWRSCSYCCLERRNALERTAQLRPDLLDTAALSEEEKMYVAQFIQQKEAERL